MRSAERGLAARLGRATRETGGGLPALACGQRARETPCHPAPSSARTSGCSPSPVRARVLLRRLARPACRCPILGLGAVLLVEGETGSYGLAGAVAGTLALRHLAGQPAVGPRHGPPRPGRRPPRGPSPATWSSGVAFVAAVVLDGPAVVVVRARRADRRERPQRRLGRPRPLGRRAWTPSGRQTAFAFEVGRRRGGVRRRAAAGDAARHAHQPAGRVPHRCRHRLRPAGCGCRRLRDTEPPVQPADADGGRRPLGGAEPDRAARRRRLPRRRGGVRRHGRRRRGLRRGGGRPGDRRCSRSRSTPAAASSRGSSTASPACRARLAARFVGCAVFFGLAAQLLFAVGLAGRASSPSGSSPG